jgi:RNA polymerase sigma-70 factor (ECF subfamily)
MPREYFATTQWTMVMHAQGEDSPTAQEALARLCRTYWFPLYAYVRRRGHSPEDAEDLTQEFFARLLGRNWLDDARREKGRFRSFLLAALKHFLANEWDRARAAKRGGGQIPISLNDTTAEGRYQLEPADTMSADRIFERRWAMTLLEGVMAKLRAEHVAAEKAELYDQLKPCLIGARASAPYAEIAARLAMSEGAVKVAVHRLRQRYRTLLREEIAQTVTGPEEVDEELRHLQSVLAG